MKKLILYAAETTAADTTSAAGNSFEISGFDDFFNVFGFFFDQFNSFVAAIKELLNRIPSFVLVFLGVFVVTVFILIIIKIIINLL